MSTAVDSDTLNALDFEYVQPCEYPAHMEKHIASQPAMFLIRKMHVCCHPEGKFFLCLSGWEHAGRVGLRCPCGKGFRREQGWKIIRVIGT